MSFHRCASCGDQWGIKGKRKPAVDFAGPGKAGAVAAGSFDLPVAVSLDKLELGTLTPPTIDFAGSRDPDILVATELDEVVEERFEDGALTIVHDVVGMNDEAHEAMFGDDDAGLTLPNVDGVVVQDVE